MRIIGAVQLRPPRPILAPHIMAGRQGGGAEIMGGLQQIAEFDGLIAADAGDRRLAAQVAVGEIVDHLGLEAAFVIEHVMGNMEAVGDPAGVGDVLAGAAGALFLDRRAMVIKLQGDADHIEALLGEQRRGDGRIDAPRHGDDHTGLTRRLVDAQGIHGV